MNGHVGVINTLLEYKANIEAKENEVWIHDFCWIEYIVVISISLVPKIMTTHSLNFDSFLLSLVE